MLRVVLDSHVPPAIAKAARKMAAVSMTPLRDWHGGIYLHESDGRLLALAWEERLTLVTYDVNTFPLVVKERLESGLAHSGMDLRFGSVPSKLYRRHCPGIGEALEKGKGLGLDQPNQVPRLNGFSERCH